MSKFKKLTDFLKSLKCRLILLCILIGIVPSVLLRAGMLGSYENRAVSIRTSEILSQAKILANQIVSNDYLNNAESESAINVQLEQLSTIYDGRVMIIDEEFHIIKDTYNLDTGKTIISEEVIKSIQGEEISKYDSQNRYIEMTIPLVHVDPETENKRTIGVIMVSVSTDSINLNLEYLARNTLVMELIAIVAIIFAGTFIAIHLVAPFHAMAKSIEEIQTGYGDDALKIDAYTETRQICEKFNKMLGRMKVLDDSRQEFVSNVSHELKTPLTSMKVLADSINSMEDAPVELYQEFMSDIGNEVDRETKIINDLLSLVKMDKSAGDLNITNVNINELLEQVKTEQIRLRKAEFELLQSQINPHFLYNTLDAIVWLAEAGEQKKVVSMVGSLSDFFRISLNQGQDILDVKEELQHVRSYLEIQQMRYQDILQYEICVPEELNHCQIPKITLQPLVENALYHGIKNKRGKGMIRIEGELDGENCILLITDNGKGMTPERLEQGRKGIRNRTARETDIYGLYNVNERIRLNFGENYGITITSTYGEGTCVTVRLPQY